MNALKKIGDGRVSVTDTGFTVIGDGLKFVYTAPIVENFPFLVGSLSNSRKDEFSSSSLIKDSWRDDKPKFIEPIIKEDRREYFNSSYKEEDSLLGKYSLGEKKSKEVDRNLFGLEEIDMSGLVDILGKLGNSHLTVEGERTPNVRINCNYDPNVDTLTAVRVIPLQVNALFNLFSDFGPKGRRVALAQRVCDRAVDDLNLVNAYAAFRTDRKAALDPVSQTMLQYLNKK